MKVLFINTIYKNGSTGRIVADLGKMLEKEGHEYMVAYGRGRHYSDSHCYRIGTDFDVCFHAFFARLTDRAGFFSEKATKELITVIRQYDPDIIHLHNLHGYYLNIKVLFEYLAYEYSGRVIWTLHDCWAYTGHCTHYTKNGCEKWKSGCHDCPQKSEYPASYLCDNSAKNYLDKKKLFSRVKSLEIVTVSDWLLKEVKQSFLKNNSVIRIYNGVDTSVFKPVENNIKKELGIEDKTVILLISDGWNQQKGYDKAVDIAKKAPDNWVFIMIGLNKKIIRSLPSNVIGVERIWDPKRLAEYYTAADIFLNPSIEETFSLVTAEALSCGTPSLVLDSTACPELIVNEKCGIVINKDSTTSDYISAITDLTKVKKYNENLLDNTFSYDYFLKQYYLLYCKES